MPQKTDKQLIKARFKKSLKTYNKEATVQDSMASKLLNRLKEVQGDKFDKIFEIGSGTGLLTRKLIENFEYNTLYINDIVEDCKGLIPENANIAFIPGDAEEIGFPENVDLIISGATFQWFTDIPAIIEKAYVSLNPDGVLAFSSFSPQNIKEITEITGFSLDYKSLEELKLIYEDKFILLYEHAEEETIYLNTPLEVLNHLKQSGVNSLSSKVWTRRMVRQFEEKYWSEFSKNGKVSLTYTPIYLILKKEKDR